jgi:hypothetical protein
MELGHHLSLRHPRQSTLDLSLRQHHSQTHAIEVGDGWGVFKRRDRNGQRIFHYDALVVGCCRRKRRQQIPAEIADAMDKNDEMAVGR